MSNINDSDDNRKPVPSTEAKLTETELEQVSGGYYAINPRTGRRYWVEDYTGLGGRSSGSGRFFF